MFSVRPLSLSAFPNLGKKQALWVLVGLSGILTAALLSDVYVDWVHQENPLWSALLGNAGPLLLALSLPYLGWRFYRKNGDPSSLAGAAKWGLTGGLGMVLFGGLAIGVQVFQQEIEPLVLLLQLSTVGALGGLFIGRAVSRVRESERRAQERRDRLKNLLEGLPVPVVHGRLEEDQLRVSAVNQKFEEVFGYPRREVEGADLYDFVVPAGKQEDAAGLDRRALEEGLAEQEVRRLTSEGLQDFQLHVASALNHDSTETYAVYTDITEQKERERRLDAIFNQTYQFTGLMEPDGTMIEVNDTALRFGGLDREEVVGKPLWETYWTQTGEESKRKLRDAIQQAAEGEFVRYERSIQGAKENRIIDFSIRPVTDEDGAVELLIPEARDITKRKNREKELRRERNLLEQAQRLAGAWEIDFRSGTGSWSEKVYEIHEVDPSIDISVEEAIEFYAPEARPTIRGAFEQCMEDEAPYDLELPIDTAKGNRRWVRTVGAPVEAENGEVVKVAGAFQDITERKEREKQLRILSKAVEQAKEAVVITEAGLLDEPGPRIEYVNEAFEEMTGYSEEEILGKTPRVLQGPETDRKVLDSLQAALEAGEEWEGETVNYRKDGTPYRVQWNVAPVRSEGGSIEHWVSVQRDVTEERRREEELRRQKSLLEQTQKLAGAWEVDLRSGDVSWSEEIYRIHEVEPGTEVSVEEAIEFYAPEARPQIREAHGRLMEEGKPYDLELPIDTANGNRRWVRTVGAVAEVEKGKIVKVTGAFQDITDRKEAERALQVSEERFRTLFEDAAIGMAVVGEGGRIVQANPALGQMTGYEVEALEGQGFEALTHPDDLGADKAQFESLLEGTQDRYQLEKRYVRADGEVFWGRLVVSRYEGPGEGTVVGMVEDIDDRKRYEQELREAKEEAEDAARLKSAMLANMSHEIRTPLMSIIGSADLLREDLEEEAGEMAEQIFQSGQRLRETLDSVLQLSRLESGAYELDDDSVRLNVIIREVAQELNLRAHEKGVQLEIETCEQPVEARLDETATRRIVTNLVENAIKFTPEGGHVQVRTRSEDEKTALLEVEDTGIGIAEEAKSEIFESFKQESEGLDREYEGSGLGLSIVHRLVTCMGGTIDFESEKGVGTRFIVRLPR